MNCWNGKMKRSSITLTYSSWRFKTVTSAPKALKSAIIASRATLSGLGGVLLAPCSSIGGRRGSAARVSRRSGGRDQGGWSPIRVTHPRAPASRPASGWRGRAGRLGASGPFGIDECSGARPCGLRQVRWRALAVPPLGMGRRGRD